MRNLINHEPHIDKIYLYAKDPYKAKYKLLINKRESTGLNYLNDLKTFIEYSNDTYDINKNTDEYNPNKKRQILIVFEDRIADIIIKNLGNKKLNPTVTELFIRGRKLNIFIFFITQSHFAVPKNIRLNSTHFFLIKIPNKRELNKLHLIIHQILSFEDFLNLYKKFTVNPYSFLVIDTTLVSDNFSRFRKHLLERI